MSNSYSFSFSYPRSDEGIEVRSLEVPASPTVILGVNGAGKTTLMKLLAGQLKPSKGAVPKLGRAVYVPQHFESINGARVVDYVSYVAWLNGAGWAESKRTAAYWIEFVGLKTHAHKQCSKLSGGQQARVQIATALNSNAEHILLDEPSAALDPLAKRELQVLYRSIAESGVGLWVSSHQPLEVEKPFEHVLVLHEGKVEFQGPMGDFLRIGRESLEPEKLLRYSDTVRKLAEAFSRNGGHDED
ncbi:ATP-binding cassette domain-containing protein [Corynebacterium jeikeium]|uniref:ATP-binding cassette domain-containing protein n=1 Tax=Corynebacterium jeikeium TaxID=38289 RepID=UPI0002FDCA30|nr:ABC transporter ATP-binding protein [Corynebacterium jeikeium]OOD33419.1 ABC transporter ATP-binding protein [Corynebacterium jeikeium]WCZ52876.1 putative ABC transporter ATP-binding protein YxlF [Corynebacterium jeikeium]SQI24586.1 ABC transporter ATP-binding protein [Corynebacterium jeikeium]SUY81817.1 ABC transporter ATP-binding protein [Corynebacterium jeikeium]